MTPAGTRRNQTRWQTFLSRNDSRGAVGGRYAFHVPALRDLQRQHADVSRQFWSCRATRARCAHRGWSL